MAGDWFPMGFWRSRCPEVVLVACRTGRDRHQVLGWLCDLWSWVSAESDDGRVRGVFVAQLHEVLGGDAPLWEAIKDAGWLHDDAHGIVVPNWENWLSESAKKRCKERNKKRRQRAESPSPKRPPKRPASVPDVSPKRPPREGTTEQDRTEEKKREEDTPLPPAEPGGGVRAYPAVPATGDEDDPGPERPRGSAPPAPPPAPGPGFDPIAEPTEVEPWGQLVAAWVGAMLPGHDAPQGIQRTPNRVAFWQARLRDPAWRDRWRDAVARAGRSLRCRGAAGGWSLRLDTFLKEPDVLVRILEGEFDDPPATLPFRPPGPGPAAPVKDVRERMREIEQAAKQQRDSTSGAA